MKKESFVVDEVAKVVDGTTSKISHTITETERKIEETVAPVRKSVLKRFPIVFILLVTFGFTATITGIEQLLLQINFLQNNPFVVLIIGLVLLVITGTLYKKLG